MLDALALGLAGRARRHTNRLTVRPSRQDPLPGGPIEPGKVPRRSDRADPALALEVPNERDVIATQLADLQAELDVHDRVLPESRIGAEVGPKRRTRPLVPESAPEQAFLLLAREGGSGE